MKSPEPKPVVNSRWRALWPLGGVAAALLAVAILGWLVRYVASLPVARANVVVGLLGALAWPTVILLVLLLFARPIARFLSHIGPRITKLTIFDVGIEVAELTEFQPAWVSMDMDFRKISPQHIFDSYSDTLFQQLTEAEPADYVIADLGDGRQWLTSRLYLFAIMLQRFRKVRAFVFLGTRGGVGGMYLGATFTENVRWALARRYPWLETAFARAYADILLPAAQEWPDPGLAFSDSGAMDPDRARWIAERFLELIQRPVPPMPGEEREWVPFEDPPVLYEKARWIDAGLLHRLMEQHLQHATATSLHPGAGELVPRIAERASPLVGIVGPDGRFQSLVDRAALLEEVALRALAQQNGDAQAGR